MTQKIRLFVKKYKIPIIAVLVIYIVVCLVWGGMIWREMLIYNKADAYFASGDYVSAKAEFEKLGETERMADCDYALTLDRLEQAEQLMESGQLELAKAELLRLGDFENAPELLLECEYRMAVKLKDEGKTSEALDLAKSLEAHPESAALIDEIQGLIYDEALKLTYECRMDEAMALYVKIPGYKDADTLYKRCSDRIVRMLSEWEEPVNYAEYAGRDIGDGILYWHRLGLIYVPKEAGAETTAMIYYPGGYDSSLANAYVTDYLNGYYGKLPNSLMLFCYANGYGDMEAKAADACAALEQAAMENNIFIHDVAVIGASMGAYTACQTAVWLWENWGLPAKYVLTLDAGGHWADFLPVMSTEDCDLVAKAGTEFYLFEGDGVGMNILAIQTMVAHGVKTTIAHVRDYGHYSIIYDAMKYGVFNWAMGDGERPENDNYTYIPLDRKSTYPN